MPAAFDERPERLDDPAVTDDGAIRILLDILRRGMTHLPITFAREA